jgi:hypothetical protein
MAQLLIGRFRLVLQGKTYRVGTGKRMDLLKDLYRLAGQRHQMWLLSFHLLGGMFQTAAFRSSSDHSMWRSSPGLTNTNGAICMAYRTIIEPP